MPRNRKPYARLLRIGDTRLDGGCLFGPAAKETWEPFAKPDRKNRVPIGNYAMLIEHPDGWILVNAGPGDKPPVGLDAPHQRSRSSLPRQIREVGITHKDIAVVIYTHLHDECAGGGTHFTASGRTVPAFPNARYFAHSAAVKDALKPNERAIPHYRKDNVQPLIDYGVLEAVDGSEEICSGVWVEPAIGPTPGHQIVICQNGSSTYAFLGALVPTSMHLWPGVNTALDWNPEATARAKIEVRRQAVAEGWLVGPVGHDDWTPSADLEELAAFSIGGVKAPVAAPKPRRKTAAPAPAPAPATAEAAPEPLALTA